MSVPASKSEPEWWSEARRLRRQGFKPSEIGKRLGKSYSAVRCATEPDFHQNSKEMCRDWGKHKRPPRSVKKRP